MRYSDIKEVIGRFVEKVDLRKKEKKKREGEIDFFHFFS